jgi:exopolyphosphatase/pppGpp-phosphohydrolase
MKANARQEVLALAESYDFEDGHSFQDARLALLLFEQTYDLHGLTEEYADLLEFAAILHDIGYWYDYEDHHKHAQNNPQQILLCDIPSPGIGFSDDILFEVVAGFSIRGNRRRKAQG